MNSTWICASPKVFFETMSPVLAATVIEPPGLPSGFQPAGLPSRVAQPSREEPSKRMTASEGGEAGPGLEHGVMAGGGLAGWAMAAARISVGRSMVDSWWRSLTRGAAFPGDQDGSPM